MTAPARYVLVDGNNLLHRAFYVFVTLRAKNGEPPLASDSGYPTGLIYGSLSILSDWLGSMAQPTKAIMFLDGVPRKRLAMDPDYKKKDGLSPFGLREADLPITLSDGKQVRHDVDVIIHVLRLLGVDVYYGEDEEADDLIGSFVKARPDDIHVIVSSDKDFYQILSDNVVLYRPGVPGSRFFDVERATEDMLKKTGAAVPPSSVRMFKSLVGDVSDNIPGVPRLRKKVAASLCHHGTPEALFATGLPGFSKTEAANTRALRGRVELNYRLVSIDSEVDINPFLQPCTTDFDLGRRILRDDLQVSGVDVNAFRFQEQGRTFAGPPVPDWLSDI